MKTRIYLIITFTVCLLAGVTHYVPAGNAVATTVQTRKFSVLKFEEQKFDFGTIREDGGKVSHSFTFRNTGSEPVVVVSATSTCGCTVPTFSRKPVMPGGTGTVEVTYDPQNRPGRFDKRIAVMTSEDAEPIKIYIAGNVKPREKSVEELYPAYIGSGVRAETNFHSFAYVEQGKSARTSVGLVNTSDKRVKINIVNASDTKVFTIEGVALPLTLEPGAKAGLTIAADVKPQSGRYGTVTETMVFEVNDVRSDATLVVTGIVIDNRDPRPDNFAPKAEINKNIVKFGAVKHDGGPCTEDFEIVNMGEAPLMIRAIEDCAEGTELSLSAGDAIAAGEHRRVEVRVSPSMKGFGPVVERVRLVTDDPSRPMREVKITMIVEN